MSKNIAVIGAGIAGITTAYYLAKTGNNVTVFEQEKYSAMRTSYANGGQISVSNSEVWTTWSNVKKGLKWMFKSDAPLLIRPRLDINQWKWLFKFLKNTIKNKYYENTKETIRMGLLSRTLYDEIIQTENIEFDELQKGILHIYKNSKYLKDAKEAKSIYNDNDCDWKMLSTEEVQKFKGLENLNGVIGGAFTKSDRTGDIHKFCTELEKVLREKYKVNFVFNKFVYHEFTDLLLDEFDCIVICAGVGSVELAKHFKDKLDIYPVKGYSITIQADDIMTYRAMPEVSILDDEAKIVTSKMGSRLRVAGTAEFAGENYDITRERIEPLLRWVHDNFPDINTSNYSSWACLRPMTPDMMPITKVSDNNNKVFYNTGHGHLGWTLAPYTAQKVTDLINAKN